MGSEVSQMYAAVCSCDNPITDNDVVIQGKLTKLEKQMLQYVAMVNEIDEQHRNETFDVQNYADDTGKMLYLFYMKMFTFQTHSPNTKSNISPRTPWIDVIQETGDEVQFNASYPDPFEYVEQELKGLSIKRQRSYLEKIWDVLLGNRDEHGHAESPRPSLHVIEKLSSIQDVSSDDEQEQWKPRFQVTLNNWSQLPAFERKVYLLKFCALVGKYIDQMDDFKDIDLVKIYNATKETLDDMMLPNSDSADPCIIM
eukprot:472475_1